MRDTDRYSPAPDYTTACVVMFGINVAWIFMVVWAIWGLLAVAAIGWGVNFWINRVQDRRSPAPAPEIT